MFFLVAMLAAIGIPVCAFLARRAQTRIIAIAAGAALTLIVLPIIYVGPGAFVNHTSSGIGFVMAQKVQLEAQISGRENQIHILRREIGHARNRQQFLRYTWKWMPWAPGAIRPGEFLASDRDFQSHTIDPKSPSEAITAWRQNGPVWLSAAERLQRAEMAQLAALPRWIDWNGLRSFPAWLWLIPFSAALVALDWVAADAGRRAFLSRRRRRVPETSFLA